MTEGALGLDQFEMRELPIPELREGQALVRVKLINIHAATKSRLAGGAIPVGQTDPHNYACAEVLESRDAAFKAGDIIACQAGWQDHQVISSADQSVGYGPANELVKALNGTNSQWTYVFRPEMARMWPPETLMDVFGTSGLTAYFGLRECGPLMPGDQVLVAGASGSVGSIAAQLARRAGCRVIGLAGGPERCAWVTDALGISGCLDYRADDFRDLLRAAFPNGVDVFSDGIGGALTATVAEFMNPNGRLLAYGGAAAQYGETSAPQARPLSLREVFVSPRAEAIIAAKNIKVEAWIVHDFYHDRISAENELSRLLLSKAIRPVHNTAEGFESLPQAIVALYAGARTGKLQVRMT